MIIEIPDYCINKLVADGLKKTVAEARHSHMTDITNRCNGEDRHHEADWVKYIIIREDWIRRRRSGQSNDPRRPTPVDHGCREPSAASGATATAAGLAPDRCR